MSRMSCDIRDMCDVQLSESFDPCDPSDMRDMRIDYQKKPKNACQIVHWDKQDKTFTFLQLINKFRNEQKVILHSRDTKKKK